MRELSIFIDESGDFGELKEKPSYYLVTMIFHEQNESIEDEIRSQKNNSSISRKNSKKHFLSL